MLEKDTIRCESVFNEDRTHRYLWKRVWNKDKPLAAIIMLNPCMANNLIMDTTTFLVVNNVARLEEYGGVEIVNLYSLLTSKLNFRWNADEDLNGPENDEYIKRAALECDTVILAWGKTPDTNQRVADRANAVLKLLEGVKGKLRVITDGERSGIHPLTPSIRAAWLLEPYTEQGPIGPAARQAAAEAKAEPSAKGRKKGAGKEQNRAGAERTVNGEGSAASAETEAN